MGAALSAAPSSWEAPLGPRLGATPTSCVVFRACKTAIPRGGCQVSPACHRPRIRALGGCAPGGGTSEGGPNTPSDLEPSPQLPESRPLGLWFVSGADSAAPRVTSELKGGNVYKDLVQTRETEQRLSQLFSASVGTPSGRPSAPPRRDLGEVRGKRGARHWVGGQVSAWGQLSPGFSSERALPTTASTWNIPRTSAHPPLGARVLSHLCSPCRQTSESPGHCPPSADPRLGDQEVGK